MAECLFCRIVSGTIPAARVYEDDAVLAIRDIDPQAPVHVLLVPKRHLTSVMDAATLDPAIFGRIASAAAHVARSEAVAARGFRLLTNVGPEGGQAVPHLHFHLLGGRLMGWPPG